MTISVFLIFLLGSRDLVAEPGMELSERLGVEISTRNFSSRGNSRVKFRMITAKSEKRGHPSSGVFGIVVGEFGKGE